MIPGFREFEFDLHDALLGSILSAFGTMEGAPLVPDELSRIPNAQGVYQLLQQGNIVYVGKTDAGAGLKTRLERHAWTVQHRHNLENGGVLFKALRVFVFTAIDLESQLIAHYKGSSSLAWNKSGFGSNDPGRNRDDTRAKPTSFDALYPIDLDRQIRIVHDGQISASRVLSLLRDEVPYIIRWQSAEGSSRKPHSDLETSRLQLAGLRVTARQVIVQIMQSLPAGWQATLLAGRVILYQENRNYRHGDVIGRS